MKLSKTWLLIIFITFFICYLQRELIKITILDFQAKRIIKEELLKKRLAYKPGTFWTLQSTELGSLKPPYFIQQIFSDSNNDYKLVRFTLDSKLNIIKEQVESPLQYDQLAWDTISPNYKIGIIAHMFSVAKSDFEKGKKYESLVVINALLKQDTGNVEISKYKSYILSAIK